MINKNEFVRFALATRDTFLGWAEYCEQSNNTAGSVDAMDKAVTAEWYADHAGKLTNKQFKAWYVGLFGHIDISSEIVPQPPDTIQLALIA